MSTLRNTVLVGDAAARLAELPDASIDMVLTSPPYFRLRNYQHRHQLGMEPHIDEWVANLRAVAAEIARVLVPTGSFWLNVADTYAAHPREGASRKSLLLGPERLLLALQDDGWLVRNKIVWAKTNSRPTPVRDRFSCTYEALFLLTRSPRYYFDLDSVRVPHLSAGRARPHRASPHDLPEQWRGPNGAGAGGLAKLKAAGLPGHPLGKNPGDVWRLATSTYRGGHFATFPIPLAERAILAGCPERRCLQCRTAYRRVLNRRIGGTAVRGALEANCRCDADAEPGLILDPFMGAGSTAVAAERQGRDWLGIELNPTFAQLAGERLASARASPPS